MSSPMQKVSSLVSSRLGNTLSNVNTWGSIITNVKTYGAKGDGLTDDTSAIQSAINDAEGGTVYFPEGEYVVSKQGNIYLSYSDSMKGYAVLIQNKSNIKLWFDTGCVIKVPMTDSGVCNAFWIENSDYIEVDGARFIGIGPASSLILEEGVGVSANNSRKITISNISSSNMRGCSRSYNSMNVTIKTGFSQTTSSSYASAHFALYQSQDSTIDDCTTYGSTLDGDIFIYGGGSANCVISNCHGYAYEYGDPNKTIKNLEAQGIMVDSGGRNCKIIDCYAYGYYYGFDIKNGTEGGVIEGCTAEKCKVGISARKGEGTAPNNFVSILGNTVTPNGGNGNTNPLIGPISDPIAIFVIDAYGGTVVDSNSIYNSIDTMEQLDFYGIIVGISDNTLDSSMGTFVISNNSISLENRNGSKFGTSRKHAIFVTTQYRMVNVSITGNAFDLPQTGIINNLIEAVNVFGLNINDNIFGALNTSGVPLIKLSGCVRVQINDNGIGPHYGILQASACVGLSFNNNVVGESNAGVTVPTLNFSNCSYLTINSNVQIIELGQGLDGEFFAAKDGSNWITAQGNMLKIANKDASNWYSTTATNFSVVNNVVD